MTPLLDVEDLTVDFRTRSGRVAALDGVSVSIAPGEVMGLVGESGSGKSVTAYAVLGLLDPAARVTRGRVLFEGRDLLREPESALERLRGREIGMVFQSPRTSLNPIRQVGRQIADVLEAHGRARGRAAREAAVEMLARVRIPDPKRRFDAYPFELSGGMCQRVLIALALACRPKLIVCDEPTTGLDVTVQAAVMDLILDLAASDGAAVLLITHDLLLAAESCDRIAVMHAGHVVETVPASDLLARSRHPYTARLVSSMPRPDTLVGDLAPVPGSLPDLRAALPLCRYAPRCERRTLACDGGPPRQAVAERHDVLCRHPL